GVETVDPQAGRGGGQMGLEQALGQMLRPDVLAARLQGSQKLGLGPKADAAVADLADPADLAHGQAVRTETAGPGAGVEGAGGCTQVRQAQACRIAQKPDPSDMVARLDALAL